MRRLLYLVLLFSVAPVAHATDHFVVCGNTNNGNGTNWQAAASAGAVGAYNDLPATLLRGDTYFIASTNGTTKACHEHQFSDAPSGTTRIFVYAATASPTSYVATRVTSIAGWTGATMDVAVAGPVNIRLATTGSNASFFFFNQPYYTIDGQIGSGLPAQNGLDHTKYGLYLNTVTGTQCSGPGGTATCIFFNISTHDIAIFHFATEGTHLTADPPAGAGEAEQLMKATVGTLGNTYLRYGYALNGYCIVQIRSVPGNTDDMVVDHIIFKNRYESANFHGEDCSCSGGATDGVTRLWFTNNTSINTGSTASGLATPTIGHPTPPTSQIGPVYIYGNTSACTTDADASLYCGTSSMNDFFDALMVGSVYIFNNTYARHSPNTGASIAQRMGDNGFYSGASNARLVNNLHAEEPTAFVAFFDPASMGTGTYVHDYNSFVDAGVYPSKCSTTSSGVHDTLVNANCSGTIPTQGLNDPFVNINAFNFNLFSNTSAADPSMWTATPNLSADGFHPDPTKDPNGTTRTNSRGAFQITGGTVTPPNAPTGLTGSASGSTVSLSWTASAGLPVPTAYTLYRGTVHNGPYTLIKTAMTSVSTTDTVANGTYFYVVTSYVGGIISTINGNGSTATVTCMTACPSFATGTAFTIAGDSTAGFNGTFTSTGQPTSSTFTFASSTNSIGSGGGVWPTNQESARSNEASVVVGAAITVSAAPSALTFSSFTVGTPSPSQNVTMTNTSGAGNTVIFSSVTFAGTNPGDFSRTTGCGTLTMTGQTCLTVVTFTPTAAGARSAILSFFDNASGSPQQVPVSGTGVAAAPGVSLSPTSLNFGDQTLSTTSTTRSIILTNTGTGTLTISSVVASGDFAVVTVPVTNCGGTLASLATCSLNVTFTPTATGGRTGAVTVTDNAAGNPHVATLSGNGITTKCQLTGNVTLSGIATICQ